jgi:hypothetical protein
MLAGLALVVSACGVKGDPISPENDAIISDGIQSASRNIEIKKSKQKMSSEDESSENKKKQNR